MKKHLLLIAFSIITALAFFFLINGTKPKKEDNARLSLFQPPFVKSVQAGTSDIGAYLNQEAGISAWFHGTPINLENLKTNALWVTLEIADNPDYLIGTMAIPNYPDQFNPHVYVHKDGWILSYYPRADSTSKIIDILARNLNTTLLQTSVGLVASAAGIGFSNVSYYDFRYPNATNLLLVAEDEDNGNYFTIMMPSSYLYYDRGFSFWKSGYSSTDYCRLTNGSNVLDLMSIASWSGNNIWYGPLSASQLIPDVTYSYTLYSYFSNAYGALVITYSVPQ